MRRSDEHTFGEPRLISKTVDFTMTPPKFFSSALVTRLQVTTAKFITKSPKINERSNENKIPTSLGARARASALRLPCGRA